jgi:hypothetical protein
VSVMLLGKDPRLEGKSRSKSGHRDKALIFADHPDFLLKLLPHDIAKDTSVFVLKIVFGSFDLFTHSSRDDRKGNQLGVGVLKGSSRGHAVVLEDEDISKPLVSFQIEDPLAIGPQNILHGFKGKRGESLLMERCFDDNLVGPNSVHFVKHSLTLPIETSFDSKGREFVWNDTEAPSRGVRGGSVIAVRKDLRRGLIFISLTQRTESSRGMRAFNGKIRGPASPLGGDDHPSPMDGVLSQFRHGGRFLHPLARGATELMA